ncbi:MAG: hypothetical protein AB7T63_17760 [Planctomycetota bacterium]
MAGTLRNLRATATAEVSNLEQGMKRAAQATRQVGQAAEETSRRGSRAMDELGRRSKVSMGVLATGGRNATTGLLQLANVAGATSGRVGGLLSTMVMGFAGGGVIGLGIAAVTSALSFLGAESRKAKEEQEKLRREQEKAAEEAKRNAERARELAKQKAEDLRQIREEIELINARSKAEQRSIENRIALRKAAAKSPQHRALEEDRQEAEARRRRREEDEKAAEASAARVKREAEQRAEMERREAEAARERTRALVEQARREFEVLTLSSEQLEMKRRQKLIQDLINEGKREEAEAVRQAIEYEKETKAREEKAKEEKRAAEETKREEEKRVEVRRRLAEAADEEVSKLRSERALLAAGTDELRKREERRQREIELIKQYGVEAMKVIQEQRRFWAEEDAREAKQKSAQARTAKRDARLNDAGVGMDRLDEKGNLVEGSLAAARQARRDATRQQKRRRAAIGRRMGRSIHDGRFSGLGGIRSGRRLDQRGPFSEWQGGAGDMDEGRRGEDDDAPGAPGHPHDRRGGDRGPTAPAFPGPPLPAITSTGDAPRDNRGEATQALEDTASATRETADALGAIAPSAKEAAEGARKTADAAGELDAPVKELVTGLTDTTQGLEQVRTSVGEAVTGIGQVVKVVNELKSEMAKLKQALDQLQKAA